MIDRYTTGLYQEGNSSALLKEWPVLMSGATVYLINEGHGILRSL